VRNSKNSGMEVKAYNLPKGRDTRPKMREELIQLAAMAVRAITDVIDKPEEVSNGTTQQVSSLNSETVSK
jgi:formiminotetrahydrofolate cyclodeaminase